MSNPPPPPPRAYICKGGRAGRRQRACRCATRTSPAAATACTRRSTATRAPSTRRRSTSAATARRPCRTGSAIRFDAGIWVVIEGPTNITKTNTISGAAWNNLVARTVQRLTRGAMNMAVTQEQAHCGSPTPSRSSSTTSTRRSSASARSSSSSIAALLSDGPRAARGLPGHRQDRAREGARQHARRHELAHPVHPRPAAVRRHGRARSTTRARALRVPPRARSSPRSCSPTRSTARARRRSRPCSRSWRRAWSPSTA